MGQELIKAIDIEGRSFEVRKFNAMTGIKVVKILTAKILPLAQTIMPIIAKDRNAILENIMDYLTLDALAEVLDKIDSDALDYLITTALKNVYERLPAGQARVMNPDGTYGVNNIEYDALLVLRLTYEAILWSVSDFFDGDRWGSAMSPLSTLVRSSL